MLGRVLLITHGDLLRAGERGMTFDVLHVVLLKVVEVDTVQSLHVVISALLHRAVADEGIMDILTVVL